MIPIEPQLLANLIKEAHLAAGMGTREFAFKCGMAPNDLFAIQNGRELATTSQIETMVGVLRERREIKATAWNMVHRQR
jgi:hypothetical protein